MLAYQIKFSICILYIFQRVGNRTSYSCYILVYICCYDRIIYFICLDSTLYNLYTYAPQKIWECKILLETSQWKQYISKIFCLQNIENMNLSDASPGIFGHIFPMTSQWYSKQMTLVQFVLWDINILTKMGSRIFCRMAKLVAVPKALNIIPRPGKKHVQKTKVRSYFLFRKWLNRAQLSCSSLMGVLLNWDMSRLQDQRG